MSGTYRRAVRPDIALGVSNFLMTRVLLIAETTGYQTRSFMEVADRLGVEVILASDRCHILDDPWKDRAIPIRFHDAAWSLQSVQQAIDGLSTDGVLALGDRSALLASVFGQALSLRVNSPDAVRTANNKLLTRERLRVSQLPHPWFTAVTAAESAIDVAQRISFPCVAKPLSLSASRGVIRANAPQELESAMTRIRNILQWVEGRMVPDQSGIEILIEEYISGHEFAVEGLITKGKLQFLAIFDKPDPLEGPFFEETIYVTPARNDDEERCREAVTACVKALGLTDGPFHAECRVGNDKVFVLECAPRPIGGLCSKSLSFFSPTGSIASFEEVLLRHAVMESVVDYSREESAAGVLMIPIPRDGLYQGVNGLDSARAVQFVEDIVITAKLGQRIQPPPDGASYLGFIFARSREPKEVESALRIAQSRLRFDIVPTIPLV